MIPTKTVLLNLLLIGTMLTSSSVSSAEETLKLVAVASYRNTREVRETVGVRVGAILNAQKINWNGAGSAGMTIVVPDDQASEALELLAKAVKEERLPLTLYGGKKGDIVTPDSILELSKSR
jgi:hypothetical protein